VEKNKKFRLPWHLLIMDVVGAMLASWGFYLYVSEGRGVLSIAVGLLLMFPLVWHLVNFSQQQKKRK